MRSARLIDSTVRGAVGGLAGGGLLVAVASAGFQGPVVYLPYAVLILALAGTASWLHPLERWHRFALVLTGFVAASLVFYLWILLVSNPSALAMPWAGHLWRWGLLLAIGIVLAAAAAFFTERRVTPYPSGHRGLVT